MGTFRDLEEARAYFAGDRFATVNGMGIDSLDEDGCVCSVDVGPDHRNALGGVMGGVIFTLSDLAFAAASNHEHSPTVALESKINFLASSKGTRLTARARRVKSGRTTCVWQVDVTDDQGRDVALVIFTGYKL